MPIIAEDYIPRVFLPHLSVLRDALLERILPGFDSVVEESNAIERDAYDNHCSYAGEDADGADLAESAMMAGLEHYDAVSGARQVTLNIFAVALSHLFEQQRHFLSLRTRIDVEPDSRKREQRYHEFLKANGIDVEEFPGRSKLEELDLVANTAKHTEGRSADLLREVRPELFVHPVVRGDSELGSYVRPVNATLMGEDLFVQPDDLVEYIEAIEQYWDFVLEALAQ